MAMFSHSLAKLCFDGCNKVVFIDCPRLMVIRPLFLCWKNALNTDRIRMLDYKELQWLCRIADVKVWVRETNHSDMDNYCTLAEVCPEPKRTLLLEWINSCRTGTYIAIGVGRLVHGFPLLTHFGCDPDPLWDWWGDDHNAFATCDDRYHVSLAYVGGMQEGREKLRGDLQDSIVDRFFKLRNSPTERPYKLLWLKQVWRKCGDPSHYSHDFSLCEAVQVDLVSFKYKDLEGLWNSKAIQPWFNVPDDDVAALRVIQDFHKRDSARVKRAYRFQSRKHDANPAVDCFTLITDVFNGLGSGDELRELCFYINDTLEYKHGIYYKAPQCGGHNPVTLQRDCWWHLSRLGFGEIEFLTI